MALHYLGYFFGHLHLSGFPAFMVGMSGLLGTIALGVGFGIYAKGKARSWAWSFLALAGLIGLIILLIVPEKAPDSELPEKEKPGSLALARIVGQMIEEVLAGDHAASKGTELRGVAGSVWTYADLLVCLHNGLVLSLSPSEAVLLPERPPNAAPLKMVDSRGAGCIGKRIRDLLKASDGEPGLYLLLEGNSYLEHSYLPGGSRHFLGDLRDLTPEELGESYVSLISGRVQSLGSLLV